MYVTAIHGVSDPTGFVLESVVGPFSQNEYFEMSVDGLA